MELGNYPSACEDLVEELRASLDEGDVAELHKALAGRPVLDWIKWRQDNISLVSAFVNATLSQRKNKKFKEHRLRLTMAGIQHCLEAQALLTVIDESFLSPGCSYRSMAAVAGEAYDRLYDFDIPDWPFDDLDSPFAEDRPCE